MRRAFASGWKRRRAAWEAKVAPVLARAARAARAIAPKLRQPKQPPHDTSGSLVVDLENCGPTPAAAAFSCAGAVYAASLEPGERRTFSWPCSSRAQKVSIVEGPGLERVMVHVLALNGYAVATAPVSAELLVERRPLDWKPERNWLKELFVDVWEVARRSERPATP